MPRAAKASTKPVAGAPAKKKSKLYAMPEKIKEGTILTDLTKSQWRIGPSIGTGGFGEIYSACRVGEKSYEYVVKCEPHGNGPLFVEMHFYMRNAKLDDIQRFKREHGLKSLGMPHMIGNGSSDINGLKHRFIVMPRYGSDIAKHFVANGRRLPEGTAYRLALQMVDVYEYVHSCGYVHADLKGANILLGYGKGGGAQAYLVDYGLASHYTTKDFKPDPKKMHNGTVEYTSRDAHLGVPTRRADFEILGYNLIEWLGGELPWVKEKLLTAPVKVQKSKEDFMANVSANLKKVFANGVPGALVDFFKCVTKMEYNEEPDYNQYRQIFTNALKILKVANSGDLDFKLKSSANNNNDLPSTSKAATTAKAKKAVKPVAPSPDSSVEMVCASDDDDDDVVFERKNLSRVTSNRTRTLKTTTKTAKQMKTKTTTPSKVNRSPVSKKSPQVTGTPSPPAKAKKRAAANSPPSEKKKPKLSAATRSSTDAPPSTPQSAVTPRVKQQRSTPVSAKANINFSPAISVAATRSLASRNGKTVINDNLTPKPKAAKTYEFNFELDVSMDANVIVNVNRKRKQQLANGRTPSKLSAQPSGTKDENSEEADDEKSKSGSGTPVTRVKVRKVGSPRTPAVTVKKSRRLVSPR